MTTKIQPPDFMEDGTSYDDYRTEVKLWARLTDVDPKKQAYSLVYLLPNNHPSDIKRKAKNELLPQLEDENGLPKPNGMEILLKFFDEIFEEDELVVTYTKYKEFENFTRNSDMPVEEYIPKWQSKQFEAKAKGVAYSDTILAFKLLDRLSLYVFDLPVNLAVQQFQQMEEAF